jgi:hypothetical protein
MIEKRKYKKVVKGGAYGNYISNSSSRQQQYPHTTSSSSSSTELDRCSKTTNYFQSENYSELLSQFKLNNKTITAIKQYNELLNQYNNGTKSGIFSTKKICRNMRNNKSGTCNTLKSNIVKARTTVLNEISQYIKAKIQKRLTKIQSNPKIKRLDKISCNIKLYTDLLNSSYCNHGKNKDYRISKLITDLKAKFPKDPELAEAYINYILKKRDNASEKLKKIQENGKFSEELKNIIKSYPDNCSR